MESPSGAPTQIVNVSASSVLVRTMILVSVFESSTTRLTKSGMRSCAFDCAVSVMMNVGLGVQFSEVVRLQIFQPLFKFFRALFPYYGIICEDGRL